MQCPTSSPHNGATTSAHRSKLLAALVAAGFDDRAEIENAHCRFDGGWLYAFKAPHSTWTYLRDRVGWVSTDGSYLQREINAKATNLLRYRSACPDVRLLVEADRIYNSGKLALDYDFIPDLQGFDAVYFFAYPLSVTPFFND